MSPLAWILCVGAVYRLSLLVTSDEITRPPREAVLRQLGHDHRLSYLITCNWCCPPWIAVPLLWSGFAWSDGWVWQLAVGTLAVSGAASFAARYAAPD